MRIRSTITTLLLPVLLALLAGCGTTRVVNPVTGQTERTVMDEPTEIAEGAKAHQQVIAESGVVADTKLQAYVDGIGQKLAQQSHRANLKWTFTVLDSPEINAFALPGGYVYVTRGIMAYLDSEADLAGVLGHEIGHVTARHGAQRATRQQTAGVGVAAATILGVLIEGVIGVQGAAQAASQIGQGMAAGRLANYSREQETQADALGAEYLARTRYDPRNMIDVIQVLKNQERFAADQARAEGKAVPEGGERGSWLASHPSNDQRLADIRQVATRYSGTYDADGRERYLKAIEGLNFGDSPAQGLVRGRGFYHSDLGIALTAPAGWRIDNSAEAVLMTNPAADAGLMLRLVPQLAGSTHEEIIRNVVKPADGRTEKRSLNGLAATHFEGTRRNAQGQLQPVKVTVASGPGQRNYLLLYVAKGEAQLRQALPQVQEAEGSFRALTAADRQAARPWQLHTAAFPAGGFAELAKASPLGARAEAQLRLLNGVYGGGAGPKVGSAVKVVR